ncbi:ionic transporter y4hA [Planctomonas sp. JC2975]|uniref:calcium:proton antiporter n=1 Tax=Planctomonas sp. JC2975 TaxID=2729626 RepID=UPI001472E621|nr:ionic transporter y4hA [Planctomonas sp. JC2975]NNC12328.1 ionic transporter y4hA [Planctomonas sp. JC2975]
MRTIGRWVPLAVPVIAAITLVLAWGSKPGVGLAILLAVILIAVILVAVHHAEVIAHRVGEPFGSLILAVAVTIIEVGLIVTLSAGGDEHAATLARDTVFSAFMITTTGLIGLSILVGAFKFGTVRFNSEGSGAALATVSTLAVLCLVLPDFTEASGPRFSPTQLTFAAIASLALYVLFVITQTISHRKFFLPVNVIDDADEEEDEHGEPPSLRATLVSLVLLLVSLVAVVGLAKLESPSIEGGVVALGLPESVVGVIIALVILLPESISAVRAAQRNHIQTSLNLGLGSAMASIGLTIPAVAVASIWMPQQLVLGLGSTQIVLLALSIVVTILTIVPGRATKLQGGVHLVIFAAFLFLSVSP